MKLNAKITRCVLALLTLLGSFVAAHAHPHVFVEARSEVVFDAAGQVTAIKHHWSFDDQFSTYAVDGLAREKDGSFARATLAPLAKLNVESLAEFGYFTHPKSSGKKAALAEPVDYWLTFADNRLTLHFTLPLKTPVPGKTVTMEIYDPTYFVDFQFARENAVSISNAPSGCAATVRSPPTFRALAQQLGQQKGEDFFSGLDASSDFGVKFASQVLVTCP